MINTGSQNDGTKDAEPGTVASATSGNNFINFCKGQVLTNGTQIPTGSCNGIVMGMVVSKEKQPAIRIQKPKNGDTVEANKNFTFTLLAQNMALGSFTNATGTYFSAPRQLDDNGIYKGHSHCVIQQTQSLTSTETLDPTKFAFFQGMNAAPESDGTLSITVTGGLPPGTYRVCTITTASNHQQLDGPVAQRGQFDDCCMVSCPSKMAIDLIRRAFPSQFTSKDGGGQSNNSTSTTADGNNKGNSTVSTSAKDQTNGNKNKEKNNSTTSGSAKNQTNGNKNDKEDTSDDTCDNGIQGTNKTGDGNDTNQKSKTNGNDNNKDQNQKTNSTGNGDDKGTGQKTNSTGNGHDQKTNSTDNGHSQKTIAEVKLQTQNNNVTTNGKGHTDNTKSGHQDTSYI